MNAVQPVQPPPPRAIPGRDRAAKSDLMSPSTIDGGRAGRPAPVAAAPPRQQYVDLKTSVHRKLLNRLNLEALAQADRSRAKGEIRSLLSELLAEEATPISLGERESLFSELVDDVFGLGPLEPLLRDPSI